MAAANSSISVRNHTDLVASPSIEWTPIGALRPNPRNARRHSKKQIKRIAASIRTFGFTNPIIVDDDSIILAGHGRWEAAGLEGLHQVPTVRLDHLTPAQKRAFVLADNKIAEQAGWDREMLAIELGELIDLLPAEGFEVSLTGFEAAEIDLLFADMEGRRDPADAVPDPPLVPVTKNGDLWLLGRHRLLCGDARDPSHIQRVIQDEIASAAFMDPPYNVPVRDIVGRGKIKHPEFAFASGEMSSAEYKSFLTNTLGNAIRASKAGAVHYVCNDWRHVGELIEAGRDLYGMMLNLCVWNKTNAGQGSFYRSQHELVGVFRVGGEPHRNNVELGRHGRNRSNVWTYPGINTFGRGRMDALAAHPTVKPVQLVVDALLDCTSRGEVVLDVFMGSGTTILAAERIGRRAFGVEYEPGYVDVAIRRWEAMTKAEALLEGDGRTFSEIAVEHQATGEAAIAPPDQVAPRPDPVAASEAEDWISLCSPASATAREVSK